MDGHWVTMNGAHVFIKNGQSPMDAFIRQKVNGKKYSDSDYELETLKNELKKLREEYNNEVIKKYEKEWEKEAQTRDEIYAGDDLAFYKSKEPQKTEKFSQKIKELRSKITEIENKWKNFGKYSTDEYVAEEKNFNNSGYSGEKMSIRATQAYNESKKPINQWTKNDLENINEFLRARNVYELNSVTELRELLKEYSGTEYHHTGKNFNKTIFYDFNDVINKFNSALEMDKAIVELRKEKR